MRIKVSVRFFRGTEFDRDCELNPVLRIIGFVYPTSAKVLSTHGFKLLVALR
jgi:hypothetical protein